MSQEVFELVRGMDIRAIETQLALQCAPLITGLKTSNLLIVQNNQVRQIQRMLRGTSISYFILYRGEEKTTLLLYRLKPLKSYLARPEVVALLRELGYHSFEFGRMLADFALRYTRHRRGKGEFPHEMGLFLGYPAEDVRGFMEHEGKDYLCAGYWKVYNDAPGKQCLFRKFDLAKDTLIQLVANGVSMLEVIDSYSKKFCCS